MIDFIFWNICILVSLYILIKADHWATLMVCYLVTLWAMLEFVVTIPYDVTGQIMNTTQYVNASNYTITTYTRDTYDVPQNFLDVVYPVYLFLLTFFTGRKVLFTELGKRMTKQLKEWWA